MRRWTSLALTLFSVACGGREPVEPSDGPVPPGFVARVGAELVAGDTVVGIAQAQHVTTRVALERAVSDALFAAEGRRRLPLSRSRIAERRALARLLLETTWAEARGAGPPTDAEVEAETQRRWWILDRPPLARTTHAVVLVKTDAEDAPARAFAQRVAAAVSGAVDAPAFRAAATPLTQEGLELRVEDLDPITERGFAVDPSALPPPGSRLAEFDPAFVKAVFGIPRVGQKSGVVKSRFGYHVILLTELIPEHRVPLEERRKLLVEDIMLARATKARDAALERARAVDAVVVERAAGELTEKVNAAP